MKLRNQRPKAFWGALIGAGTSIASSLIGANSQKDSVRVQLELQKRQRREDARLRNATNLSNTLNNYAAALASYNEDELEFAKGGKIRRKLRNVHPIITDGGVAEPIGNNTFLLRGGSHEDINESGNTGIGINVNGKEIEAEGGEILQNKGNYVRIFSDQPILNGISPAEAVLAGDNKDYIFNEQERVKQLARRRNGLRCGGRIKARWGIKADGSYGWIPDESRTNITLPGYYYGKKNDGTFGLIYNVSPKLSLNTEYTPKSLNKPYSQVLDDNFRNSTLKNIQSTSVGGLRPSIAYGINTGLDFLGSIGSALISNKTLRDIQGMYDSSNFDTPDYVEEAYIPFNTRVYTGARQAELRDARNKAIQTIGRNTASSNDALSRMQGVNTETTEEINKLWEDASNKNLELRKANVERAQQVAARNASARNAYNQSVSEFKNRLALGRINNRLQQGTNWASLIGSLATSAANGIQNYLDYQTNGANIALATLPYLNTNEQRQAVWDSLIDVYGKGYKGRRRGAIPNLKF